MYGNNLKISEGIPLKKGIDEEYCPKIWLKPKNESGDRAMTLIYKDQSGGERRLLSKQCYAAVSFLL